MTATNMCSNFGGKWISHLLKMVKTRLRSCLSNCSVQQLMRISIEGLEIDAVEFEETLEIFERYNHRIQH